MTGTAESARKARPSILERMRMDIRLGRHHPRGTASARLIRRWGFRRVMKHMNAIRRVLDRVEAEAIEASGGNPDSPPRQRTHFPGDRGRGHAGAAGRTLPVPPSLSRPGRSG